MYIAEWNNVVTLYILLYLYYYIRWSETRLNTILGTQGKMLVAFSRPNLPHPLIQTMHVTSFLVFHTKVTVYVHFTLLSPSYGLVLPLKHLMLLYIRYLLIYVCCYSFCQHALSLSCLSVCLVNSSLYLLIAALTFLNLLLFLF